MTRQQESIAAEEFVLRRIHKNHYDPRLPVAITPLAFRPTPEDVVGISVYREKYISPVQVAEAGRQPGQYYVARLPVQALAALNLTVVPDDEPAGPPGHAIIPELSTAAYQQNKQRSKDLQMALARLASQAIVH